MTTTDEIEEMATLLYGDLRDVIPKAALDGLMSEMALAKQATDAYGDLVAACLPLLRDDRTLAARSYRARQCERWRDHSVLLDFVQCVHARGEDVAAKWGPWLPMVRDDAGELFAPALFDGFSAFTRALDAQVEDAPASVTDAGEWTYVYEPDATGGYRAPIRIRHWWVLGMLRDGFDPAALVEALAETGYQQTAAGTVLRERIPRPLAGGAL